MSVMIKEIHNYDDFIDVLQQTGFSMGGGNSEGIYSIVSWDWNEQPPYETPVRWHTEDRETDPWEWRMRVLQERDDIAYGKVFFKKSGYITKEWMPYFIKVRRDDRNFIEAYEDGLISNYAKRIYSVVADHESLPLHLIKPMIDFKKEEKSQFDRAIVELQMKMYLTMCGSQQKVSEKGEAYGWSSTVFCTAERYFGDEVFRKVSKLKKDDAIETITRQVIALNPEAVPKKIQRFING